MDTISKRKFLKKIFNLHVENKEPQRVVESIKNEIRKYIKREQKKALPENTDYWFFDCKFAKNEDEPRVIEFVDIIKNVNEASEENCQSFYLEILARAQKRPEKTIEEEINTDETEELSIIEEN